MRIKSPIRWLLLSAPPAWRCATGQDLCGNSGHVQPPADAWRRRKWNWCKRPSSQWTVTAALHTAPPSSTHQNVFLQPILVRFSIRGNAVAAESRCLSQIKRRYVASAW